MEFLGHTVGEDGREGEFRTDRERLKEEEIEGGQGRHS